MAVKAFLVLIASAGAGLFATLFGASADTGWRRLFFLPGMLAMRWSGMERGGPPENAIVGLVVNFLFFAVLAGVIGAWGVVKSERRPPGAP